MPGALTRLDLLWCSAGEREVEMSDVKREPIEVSSAWEEHAYITQQQCECGGAFDWGRADLAPSNAGKWLEVISVSCAACNGVQSFTFDVTDSIRGGSQQYVQDLSRAWPQPQEIRNTPLRARSHRSAQRIAPVSASISCPVTRTRSEVRRMAPVRIVETLSLSRMLERSFSPPRSWDAECQATTCSPLTRVNRCISSSVRPSLKYWVPSSGVKLVKGSITRDTDGWGRRGQFSSAPLSERPVCRPPEAFQ
jgi:hypothetical protein